MLVYTFGVLFVAMSLAYSYGLTMLCLLQLHICISCRRCMISQEDCGSRFPSPPSPFG